MVRFLCKKADLIVGVLIAKIEQEKKIQIFSGPLVGRSEYASPGIRPTLALVHPPTLPTPRDARKLESETCLM